MWHCPKDASHKRFVVYVYIAHEWVMDENGEFIEDEGAVRKGWLGYDQEPRCCAECGADATEVEEDFQDSADKPEKLVDLLRQQYGDLSDADLLSKVHEISTLALKVIDGLGEQNTQDMV